MSQSALCSVIAFLASNRIRFRSAMRAISGAA
jgi:hypothetical protein